MNVENFERDVRALALVTDCRRTMMNLVGVSLSVIDRILLAAYVTLHETCENCGDPFITKSHVDKPHSFAVCAGCAAKRWHYLVCNHRIAIQRSLL